MSEKVKEPIFERYKGTDPYICLLFSEKDRANVIPLINALQTRHFRLWYPSNKHSKAGRQNHYQERLTGASLILFFAGSGAREDINVKNDLLYCSGQGMPIISYTADKGESNLIYGLPESVPEVSDEDELIRTDGFSTDLIGDKPKPNTTRMIRAAAALITAAAVVFCLTYGYYRYRIKKAYNEQTMTVLHLETLPDDPAELEKYPELKKIVIPQSEAENGKASPYLDRYTVIIKGDGK